MKVHITRLSSKVLLIVLCVLLLIVIPALWFMKNISFFAPSQQNSDTEQATQTTSNDFVIRSGTSLLLHGRSFRFSGANIYWLGLQERNAGAYPSHFQVDDALATASWMGATVVRSHTLGLSVGCTLCVEPTLGTFHAAALQQIDYAIASAKKHHLRLIVPLIDNWHYYHGGKASFTRWRGLAHEQAFYSNPLVISDFEQAISHLFTHINTFTGVAYKDDPTILAWETGNELSAPRAWVERIANFIKSKDHHHLLMDGNYEQADEVTNFVPDLSIPTLDLYTGHYYPPTLTALQKEMKQVQQAKKVFIVGEYDWNTHQGDALPDFLQEIEHSNIAGDLYWSLFPHDDSHGFVEQREHYTLYYPGETPEMRWRVALLCQHAYAMQGLHVPLTLLPGTPMITSVVGNHLLWRGAFGAATYTIERSTQGADGPWRVICDRCATDQRSPWIDPTQPVESRWYRIKAYSVSGIAGPYSKSYRSAGKTRSTETYCLKHGLARGS